MSLQDIMAEIKKELDSRDARREEVFTLAREIRRASTHSIKELHRGNLEEASLAMGKARKKLSQLGREDYRFSLLQEAIQEYAEGELILSLLKKEDLPSPRDLRIPEEWYVLGLGDAIGELRRHILDLIRQGEYGEINYYLEVMEDITQEILALEYPPAVLNIRRKQDVAKMLIERTLSDVVRAEKERRLLEEIERLGI